MLDKNEHKLNLDPLIDLVLGGLGFFILTLFGIQFFILLKRFFPETRAWLLICIGACGVAMGILERKIRRGEFDWPRLMRITEVTILLGLSWWAGVGNKLISRGLGLLAVFVLYQLADNLAKCSEDLLFDFAGFKTRDNWQQRWEIEGYRLYDRHIQGFRKLQYLFYSIDAGLVFFWLIRGTTSSGALIVGILIIFLQLFFFGVAFYQKKLIFWAIYGYRLEKELMKKMLGLVLALALLVSTVTLVLPVNYNPIPWKAIAELLNHLTQGGMERNNLVFPETENLEVEESAPEKMQLPLEVKASWHVWIFIGFIACIVLFFLGVVLSYLISFTADEKYRLQGFGKIFYRICHYVQSFFLGLLTGFKKSCVLVKDSYVRLKETNKQARMKNIAENFGKKSAFSKAQNYREEIIFLFVILVNKWQTEGMIKNPADTFEEYLEKVVAKYPINGVSIKKIQGLSEEAMYSSHSMNHEQVEEMRQAVEMFLDK